MIYYYISPASTFSKKITRNWGYFPIFTVIFAHIEVVWLVGEGEMFGGAGIAAAGASALWCQGPGCGWALKQSKFAGAFGEDSAFH